MSSSLPTQHAASASTPWSNRAILDAVEDGQPLSPAQALQLLAIKDATELAQLRQVAECVKKRQVGNEIFYETGVSLFLTNVCEMAPVLYPYPRQWGQQGSYVVTVDDLDALLALAKLRNIQRLTVSGGGFSSALSVPGLEAPTVLKTYVKVLRYIQDQWPDCQIEGFSPDEVDFLAVVSNRSERYILECLKDNGLRVLGGFGTEVLEDGHRARLSIKKLTVKRWLEIVGLAHQCGIPSVAHLEAGPLESWAQRVKHLTVLRQCQEKQAGVFTRLMTQMWPYPPPQAVPGAQPMLITEGDALKLTAMSRLFLGDLLPQQQLGWTPGRLDITQRAFEWGGSHAGGTHGLAYFQFLANRPIEPAWTESELRGLIQDAGQTPQQSP